MGYVKCSGRNADYVVGFTIFGGNEPVDYFKCCDAVIIEGDIWAGEDSKKAEDWNVDIVKLKGDGRYSGLITDFEGARRGKPIWIVDTYRTGFAFGLVGVGLTAKLFLGLIGLAELDDEIRIYRRMGWSRRDFLRAGRSVGILLAAEAIRPIVAPLSLTLDNEVGSLRKAAMWVTAESEIFPPTFAGRIRDALTALKAERFIAPRMAEELGRRPVIGVLYNPNHASISYMLADPNMAEETLLAYGKKLSKWMGAEYAQRTIEWRFKGGKWQMTEHQGTLRMRGLELLDLPPPAGQTTPTSVKKWLTQG